MKELALLNKELAEKLAQQQNEIELMTAWKEEGERLLASGPAMFMLGVWWADRPWRT